MNNFIKEDLEFYLPTSFKGLSKEYILTVMFDKTIQKNWLPQDGDLIVGCTGNIFAISSSYPFDEKIGGTHYFFGGGLCASNSSNFCDQTFCYVLTKDGKEYDYNGIAKEFSPAYSKISDYRFIPYPPRIN